MLQTYNNFGSMVFVVSFVSRATSVLFVEKEHNYAKNMQLFCFDSF
jgi:hypothetical protein